MTGPEHYRAAEQLQQHARAVMKAQQGPPTSLSSEERAGLRDADLAEAQIHATLVLAAAIGHRASLPQLDALSWREVAATSAAVKGL